MKLSPTEVQIAWAAGIIEGEGCIHTGRTCSIQVSMADRDVVETLDRIFPSPGGVRLAPREVYKDRYLWKVAAGADIRSVLEYIFPLLGQRRKARALDLLAELDARPGKGHNRLLRECKHGHPFDRVNTYVDKRGRRTCRKCRNERARGSHGAL